MTHKQELQRRCDLAQEIKLPINEFVGRKLRELRLKKGWSMEKLSLESTDDNGYAISKQSIEHWENGKNSPLVSKLDRTCQALGITIADFFLKK